MESTESFEIRRRKIIKIFAFFKQICQENSLRWYGCAGTALGAVRHHGMIPWDDDVDVAMPRPDYEKFIKICEKTDLGEFELVNPVTDKGYYYPFLKLCDKHSTIWEYRDAPFVFGVFMDIFPIDGASDNKEEFKSEKSRYWKYYRLFTWEIMRHRSLSENTKLLCSRIYHRQFKYLIVQILSGIARQRCRKFVLERMKKISTQLSYDDSEYVAVYCGTYREREWMPNRWFSEGHVCKFEDMEIMIPKEYDKYLQNMFGNYMEWPPVEKRKSHHNILYINLEERKNTPEISELLKL